MTTVSRIPLGTQQFEVSRFIAGFWRLNQWKMTPQRLLAFIEECVELGVTTMDHAMVYRSESLFGDALALQPSLRDKIEIISKCGISPVGFGDLGAEQVNHYDTSASAIIKSVDASLSKLQTNHLDILLIHRPDYLINSDEVAETFSALKEAGKVSHFGVSNFTTAQFDLLQQTVKEVLGEGLVTNQIEFSPYNLQALDSGVFEQCQSTEAVPMLWSCLAGGKILSADNEKGKRLLQALSIVAEEQGVSALEPVIYAWVLALPTASLPLLGTGKIERVKLALQAENLSLSREQWYRIWEASCGYPVS